eukprot:Gb_29243 [translate_table: standard]
MAGCGPTVPGTYPHSCPGCGSPAGRGRAPGNPVRGNAHSALARDGRNIKIFGCSKTSACIKRKDSGSGVPLSNKLSYVEVVRILRKNISVAFNFSSDSEKKHGDVKRWLGWTVSTNSLREGAIYTHESLKVQVTWPILSHWDVVSSIRGKDSSLEVSRAFAQSSCIAERTQGSHSRMSCQRNCRASEGCCYRGCKVLSTFQWSDEKSEANYTNIYRHSSLRTSAIEASTRASGDVNGVKWSCSPFFGLPTKSTMAKGKRLVFVTNNSTKSRKQYGKKFEMLGLTVGEEEIFASSFAAAAYLKSVDFPQEKKVWIIHLLTV